MITGQPFFHFQNQIKKKYALRVPEFIDSDPVIAKTSPKRSFSMSKNERFFLVFAKTGPVNSGTGLS
jgi:hypothetical protein